MAKLPIAQQNLNPNTNYNSSSGVGISDVVYQPVFLDPSSRNAEFANMAKMVPDGRDLDASAKYLYDFNMKLTEAETHSFVENNKLSIRKKIADYMQGLQQNPDHTTYMTGLQKIAEESKTNREKMPEGFARNQVEMNDADAFTEASVRVSGMANKVRIDKLKTDAWGRLNDYVKVGDFKGAETQADEGLGQGYLTPAEHSEWKQKIMPLKDVYSVENGIKNNPETVTKLLNEKTDDGIFKNYPHLSLEQRDHLTNAAQTQVKQQQETNLETFNTALYQGKLTTDMIDTAVNQKLIKSSSALALKEKLTKPERKEFDADAYEKVEAAFQDFSNEKIDRKTMMKTYAEAAGKLPESYIKHIWENIEEVKNPESIKKSFPYKAGTDMIEQYYKDKKLYSDPPGLGNKRSSPEDMAINKAKFEKAYDDFFKNNPKATPDQAIEFVKAGTKRIQEDLSIDSFSKEFAPSKKANETVKAETKNDSKEVKRFYHGKTAVFDSETKKFIRYE